MLATLFPLDSCLRGMREVHYTLIENAIKKDTNQPQSTEKDFMNFYQENSFSTVHSAVQEFIFQSQLHENTARLLSKFLNNKLKSRTGVNLAINRDYTRDYLFIVNKAAVSYLNILYTK